MTCVCVYLSTLHLFNFNFFKSITGANMFSSYNLHVIIYPESSTVTKTTPHTFNFKGLNWNLDTQSVSWLKWWNTPVLILMFIKSRVTRNRQTPQVKFDERISLCSRTSWLKPEKQPRPFKPRFKLSANIETLSFES